MAAGAVPFRWPQGPAQPVQDRPDDGGSVGVEPWQQLVRALDNVYTVTNAGRFTGVTQRVTAALFLEGLLADCRIRPLRADADTVQVDEDDPAIGSPNAAAPLSIVLQLESISRDI
jgi:hypothetical protein